MTKEELININGIREDLYQAMQIGDITLSSKDSQKLVDFMNYQDKEIERLNNIIKEQGLEDKSNYYVKGLEGSLKEYQDEVKRLNNIINEFNKWLENINIGELDDLFIGVKLSELKKAWNDIKGSDKEC